MDWTTVARRGVVGTVALVMGLAASGCGVGLTRQIAVSGATSGDGPLAVDVSNFSGPVRVRVDDRVSEPEVLARLRLGSEADKEARRKAVDLVWVRAEVVDEPGGRIFRVESTRPEEWRLPDPSVRLMLKMPSCEGARVYTNGGTVEVLGASGALEVVNGSDIDAGGDIIIRTGAALTEDVTLRTTRGDVRLQMGTGSAGRLDLATKEGDIAVRSSRGSLSRLFVSSEEWRAVLNGGSNEITIRVDEGDIEVRSGRYGP